MNKILSVTQITRLSVKLRQMKKRIVLVGGCFDLLHSGHIAFLKAAKSQGDTLIVLLESDSSIRKMKGEDRPINNQKTRAEILAVIEEVDFVIMLPELKKDLEYDNLVLMIKPAIIATTKGDSKRLHKERQAKLIKAIVVDAIERIPEKSTTKLVNTLSQDQQL